MRHRRTITTIQLALALLVACAVVTSASAQELSTALELESLCAFSEPAEGASEEAGERPSMLAAVRSRSRRNYAFERAEHLLRSYTAAVPAEHFTFTRVDDVSGLLSVGTFQPLTLFEHYGLSLSNTELHLGCAQGALDVARMSHDAGLLRLVVEFELTSADEPQQAFCRAEGERLVVQGHVLSARLVHVGTDEELCVMQTERGRERRVRLALQGGSEATHLAAEVEITKLETIARFDPGQTQDDDAGPRELGETTEHQIRNELEAALLPCYQRAIAQSGRRQGALTFRAALDATGRLEQALVTIDVLDSESTSGCCIERINGMRFEGLRELEHRELGFIVIFRIDERGDGE